MSERRSGALRWGIVGTGQMADGIARAVRDAGGHPTVVISRTRERGQAFATRHGIERIETRLDTVLDADGIDAIYVGSPNALHPDQALLIARAGVHVLVEKPLAVRSATAARLLDDVAGFDVRVGTTFQGRYHPVARRIREMIATGRVGSVELIRIALGFGPEVLVGWRADPAMSGAAAVNNLGVHAYDMLRFLLDDEIASVTGLVEPGGGSWPDRTALAMLRSRSGVLAYAQVSQALSEELVRIEIQASRGSIDWSGWMAPYRTGHLTIRSDGAVRRSRSACPDAYTRLVSGFMDAVRDGRQPTPSGRDGLEAVRIAEAVIESGATGRRVDLSH